jgi:hypothetical protein
MKKRTVVLACLLCASACGGPDRLPADDLDDVEILPDPEPVRPPSRTGGQSGGAGAGGTAGASGSGGGGGPGGSGPAAVDAGPGGTETPPDAAPLEDGAAASDAMIVAGDAAPRDAASAPATAPGLGGAASCASPTGVVCEDFEKTMPGALPAGWGRQGSAQVIAESPARGSRALRARSPQNSNYSINRITRRTTIPGTHWGRVYFKVAVPSPRPPSGVIHATFVAFGGNLAQGGAAEFRVLDTVISSSNKYLLLYNVQPVGGREFGRATGYNWQFDGRWHCAEWYIDHENQEFRLHMDGGDTPLLAFKNGPGKYDRSQIPRSFSSVSMGITHYQNSRSGFDVAFDELVIDAKRVGCK